MKRHRARGAALLTAMIIVALIATLASSMLWQQWRAVQVEAAERERAQSAWILAGALDWARLILREDARSSSRTDHLGEPWAVPLQEARLSSFLAVDKGEAEDAPDAFLSGDITDAQARFNLGSLVVGNKVDENALKGFAGLCESLGVAGDVATRIAGAIRDATPLAPPDPSASPPAAPVTAPANPPLMPRSTRDLGWLGVGAESQRVLEPYVTLLPQDAKTNVNTASREVLAASIPGLDLATAEKLVQYRQRKPFETTAEVSQQSGLPDTALGRVDVKSSYFIVRGRLRLGQVVLEQRSLVQRRGTDVYVLQRERIPGRDSAGG